MPNKKKNLQTAEAERDLPVPPSDLWEEIDRIVTESTNTDKGISSDQFAERYGIRTATARARLRILERQGKMVRSRAVVDGVLRSLWRPTGH